MLVWSTPAENNHNGDLLCFDLNEGFWDRPLAR